MSRIAVEEIESDLSDRRGLGHEWGAIDEDVQEEIRETWRAIIDARIAAAVAAEREACIVALHHLPDVITGAGRLIEGALCRTAAIDAIRARGGK
jgi:hypothetical protein